MNKITRYLIVIFTLLFQFSYSQDWVKSFPSWAGMFQINLFEYYDKGYIFLTGIYGTGSISYSIILKTDINGNLLWHKTIGDGIHSFMPSYLEETSDHGMIFCGSTNKYGGVNPDPYLIKFNKCGEMEWCSVIQTPGIYDFPRRVKQTPNGEYIMLTAYSDPNEYYRIQLFKISSTGSWIWKHNYPPTGGVASDDGRDLTVLGDGYLITAECYAPDSGQVGGGAYERPYYIKTDTSGNDVWRLVYGSSNGYHGFPGYATLKSQTGNFYSVGWHSNFCDTPAITKVTSNGTESYYQDVLPGACPGGDGSINFLADTTLVVFAGGTINGNVVLKWLKLDTMGITKFYKEFSPGYIEGTGWTIVTSDKKIVGLSVYNSSIYLYKLNSNFDPDSIYTHPYVYDSLCTHPIASDTINPDCGLLVNINDQINEPANTQLKIYPNPANKMITIEFPKYLLLTSGNGRFQSSTLYNHWGSTILEIFDLTGKMIFQKTIPFDMTSLYLNVSLWNSGMHSFRLNYNNQTVAKYKLIIQK